MWSEEWNTDQEDTAPAIPIKMLAYSFFILQADNGESFYFSLLNAKLFLPTYDSQLTFQTFVVYRS